MAKLSVREAAYRVGVTRQTLFKYIRQGKVSATVGHDGQKQIDVAELIRVFGELQPDTVTSGYSSDNRTLSPKPAATATNTFTSTTTALQMELERMKAQLQFKEAELALAKERIDELKARELDAKHREREATEERMRMLGVIETQNRLLAAPEPVLPIKPAPRPARKTAAEPVKPRTTTKPKAAAVKETATKAKPTPARAVKSTALKQPKKAATASATTKAKSVKSTEKKATKSKATKKAQ